MSNIIYNNNGLLFIKDDLHAMVKLLNNKKICEIFDLKFSMLSCYMAQLIIFNVLGANQKDSMISMINNRLQGANITVELLKKNEKITQNAIDLLLVGSSFVQMQLGEFHKRYGVQSGFFQEIYKNIFIEENRECNYQLEYLFKNGKKVISKKMEEALDPNYSREIIKMKVGESISTNNGTIKLLNKHYTNKKCTVYKIFYIILKDMEEAHLQSFILSMPSHSANAILTELKNHYKDNIVYAVPRSIYSSSKKEDDQNIIKALAYRTGNCFINPAENSILLLIVDSICEQDVVPPQDELTSEMVDILLAKITEKIIL